MKHQNRVVGWVLVATICAIFTAASFAETVLVTSTKVAYIKEGVPNNNYGAYHTAKAWMSSGDRQRPLIQFDTSSFDGKIIQQATLRLRGHE